MKVDLIKMTEDPIDVMWVAARTCYSAKSPNEMWEECKKDKFNVLAAEKHWKLVKAVLDSGHSCYDDQTEVLTSKGFKLWKNITQEDLIAAIEPLTHEMHFEKPSRLVKSEYSGKMYLFDNKYINLCVTPNHRLYSSLISKCEGRKLENFNFYKCEDVIYKTNKSTNVEVALRPQKFKTFCKTTSTSWYNPLNLEKDKLVAFNKLMGFFVGDGYSEGGNRLEFHLKKERKIKYLKEQCEELGWDFREYDGNKYKVFAEDIGSFARSEYYSANSDKQIPNALLSSSKDCIEAFIDGLKNSDGFSYGKDSFSYTTTSAQVANLLQALVHIIGGHASIKNKNHAIPNWKESFKLEIRVPNNRSYVLVNDSRHIKRDTEIVDYKGYVYCCEVSTGLLMVRRNNKICLCGNSVAEHITFTFAIEGISRACSHQLVRHRAGIVFSQQSQRYVEIKESYEEVRDLVLQIDPMSVYGCEDDNKLDELETKLLNILQKYFIVREDSLLSLGHSLMYYLQKTDRGIKPEDARSDLPNATKTNITMTVNFRELMHLCNLRLCTRAQFEIRNLFREIVKCVRNKNEYLASYLVPQCEVLGVCTEKNCCGRAPRIQEVMEVYNKKEV